MERSSILAFLGIVSFASLDAQPVLTYDNIAPVAGTGYQVLTGSGIGPGLSGPDQTWDFTGFIPTSSFTDSVLLHGPDSNCDLLAGVNLRSADGMLRLTDTTLECAKRYWIGGQEGYFAGMRYLLSFPMTYGDTISDSWYFGYIDTLECGGDHLLVSYVTADAYGQILTPFGSFGPVLRIHTHCDFFIGPMPFVFDECRFYLPDIHYPIVVCMDGFDFSGIPWNGLPRMINPNTVSMYEDKIVSRVFMHPNPTTDQLFIDLPIGGDHGEVTIRDASGRMVDEEVIVAGEKQHVIAVNTLVPGAYSLTWSCASGHSSLGTFIKQ